MPDADGPSIHTWSADMQGRLPRRSFSSHTKLEWGLPCLGVLQQSKHPQLLRQILLRHQQMQWQQASPPPLVQASPPCLGVLQQSRHPQLLRQNLLRQHQRQWQQMCSPTLLQASLPCLGVLQHSRHPQLLRQTLLRQQQRR